MKSPVSSWNKSSHWYSHIVGKEGHYYHQHSILPVVTRLLDLPPQAKLLDVGCGQGILARAIPSQIEYWGVDASAALIKQARQLDTLREHRYIIGDATKKLTVPQNYFTHAAIILALQNMQSAQTVIQSVAEALQARGSLVMALNHPCFRIPRQSGWDVDQQTKQQRRWITRYLTPMDIPITMHPGKNQSEITHSYHLPLSAYAEALTQAHLVITGIEELTSDKESVGKAAKMENRSRNDIPLFMVIQAKKLPGF